MKQNIRNIIYGVALAVLLFAQTSCKKNFINPGAPTDQQVFSSIAGLTGVAVGIQRVYTAGRASSLYNKIALNGLLTLEDTVLNQGNTSEYNLERGAGNVDGTNTILGGLWTTSNKIIYDADKAIAGLNALSAGVTDKGYVSGLLGYLTIFKALALGDLSMFWEKVPSGIGLNVTFVDRAQGFAKAITAIDAALAAIAANAISSTFLTNIPAGIDIVNTLHALKARYSLFTGNYAVALSEANLVNLSVKSTFNFTSVNLNPIFETATSTNNVYGVHGDTLGLPTSLKPAANDMRVPFYYTTAYLSRILGFGAASTTPWPVYLPGEMTLIKAEAYARMATPDLVNGLIELNKVVTKLRANDPFGVGAELPPSGVLTQQQLLDQIYRNRSIELFMSGLRLEDQRRFGRPLSERKRNLLPFPFLERDNNINTPPDPSF
jgi:hypothetical protein